MNDNAFQEAYKKLNTKQQEAVDTIEGPVMVVAGPGTGKTEILALRIANIRTKTDTQADGILCLTFTNAGVSEMRNRLRKYIGAESSKVHISTFHSFGMKIIEEHYGVLDLDSAPKLLDEEMGIGVCDTILHENEWEHLKPRGDASRYWRDLKSLISILKREGISPDQFREEIKKEIKKIKDDPSSISSRGESKGELKKDAIQKMEKLSRTIEVVKFYECYEETKKKDNLFDYDDVLENLVKIVETSEDAASDIKEKYLYVLIDEHQDSSGVQNEFLRKVWGDEDKPNIFVVGDDRQLIYGFGGASLLYFQGFEHSFGKAKLIILTDNYRSTQDILDASHMLLESKISKEKLMSNNKESYPLHLVEAQFSRDEIIACGVVIKEKIKEGSDPDQMALLVPKNRHVKNAVLILRDMGIPVSVKDTINFFDAEETQSLIRILRIISNPFDLVSITGSFFDRLTDIPPLLAHKYVKENQAKNISLLPKDNPSLFNDESQIEVHIKKMRSWIDDSNNHTVYSLIQKIADEFLLKTAKNHEELVKRVEVVRTFLNLAFSKIEKNPKFTLQDFIAYLDRLESYGEHIPMAVFSANEGVKVLTLHGSKGMEFDFVWIAHMDERSLMSGKNQGFTLPESIEEKIEKKDMEIAKRELYVAITRAKRFCTISYSLQSSTGIDQELAHIISDLPDGIFIKQNANETEKIILAHDPKAYTEKKELEMLKTDITELGRIVAMQYSERKVSVSMLNNFFECPWKWYFRNLLQLPEEKNEHLEFGDKVHKAVDQILKLNQIPNDKELSKIVNEDKEVLKVISDWVKKRLPDISLNRENEQPVSVIDDRFPHLNIYGKIDLIEKMDKDNLRVTDFKTGGAKKKSEIEKLDEEGRLSNLMRQLAMYSYLLAQSPKWKKDVRESRLEFLETKVESECLYNTVIQPDQIKLLVQDIIDYDNLLKRGEWLNRSCNFKSYGKMGAVCEYCKIGKAIYH